MSKTTLISPETLWPGYTPPLTKRADKSSATPGGQGSTVSHKITPDGAAAVSLATQWIPIGPDTPRGVKLQLISRKYGVAHYGPYLPGDGYHTHWYPLPTFAKGET